MTYSDPEYVTIQYRDASKLNARIALHQRFSTNPQGLSRWILDQFDLPKQSRLLEVGCGPGRLWTENLDSLPEEWSITLTDASPGMVAEGEARLGSDRRFEFRVADASEIPFEEGRFDAVVANHMLYHVPDRALAIRELRRVLRPGGVLLVVTNADPHLRELDNLVVDAGGTVPERTMMKFKMENGGEELREQFGRVDRHDFTGELVIPEAGPILDYIASMQTFVTGTDTELLPVIGERLATILKVGGEFRITTAAGCFVCR